DNAEDHHHPRRCLLQEAKDGAATAQQANGQAAKRRALGMRPQSESLSATEPWKELGMTRRTWYRKNKPRTGMDGTTLAPPIFLSCEDRTVPTGLSEESKRESVGARSAPKEEK